MSRRFAVDEQPRWTPWTLLCARAESDPDSEFLTFQGQTTSFGQAAARACQVAAVLGQLGMKRGDRLAVMLSNRPEFLDLWFASARMGLVMVPVNTALKGDGLAYVLEHSAAQVLIVEADRLDAVATVRVRLSASLAVIVCGDGVGELRSLMAQAGSPPAAADVRATDLASILYTSGTTGLPKGVENCHNAYVVAGHEFVVHTLDLRDDDVLYTSLPLFHINAQSLTTMGSLISGCPMVLSPRFSASRFFEDLTTTGATVFNYIGAMLTMLYKQPEALVDRAHRVRVAVGGAAPLQVWRPFERRFGLQLHEIYGLTETACFCLSSPRHDIHPGTVGRPVSWSEVEVHTETGDVAPPDQPGEIVVRAKRDAVLMLGYHKNQVATKAALEGGWFHTGDRGVMDSDGYFRFVDRMKDSIRRRGENISSYEVERVVNEFPAVAESAAIGVPSELGEDEVMVVITLRGGFQLDPAALITFCAERLAEFMVPRYLKVVEALPKTGTERVQKFRLREFGSTGAWDRERPERVSGLAGL